MVEPTERTALASADIAVAVHADSEGLIWFRRVDRRGACALVCLFIVSVVAGVLAAGSRPHGFRQDDIPAAQLRAQKVEPPLVAPIEMNSEAAYTIANAPSKGSAQVRFRSTEFFEVYTDWIALSYLQVHWQDHDLELPIDIRLRFRGQTMGIVGWEVDIVRGEGVAESSVPNHEIYHHHHVATWWGLPQQRTGRLFTNRTASRIELDPDKRPATAMQLTPVLLPGVKRVQVTNLINGGENRNTFTGLPRGFAQLIEEPSTVRLTAMLISTSNTDISAQRHGPIPKESLRPASYIHSAPTDCPCTDLVAPRWSDAEQSAMFLSPAQIGWCRTQSLLTEGNPSCHPKTYQGGLSCCYDGARLLNQVCGPSEGHAAHLATPHVCTRRSGPSSTPLLAPSPCVQEQLAGEAALLVQHVERVRMKYRVYFTSFDLSAQLPVHALEWSLLGCRMSECIHPEFDASVACPNALRPQWRPQKGLARAGAGMLTAYNA